MRPVLLAKKPRYSVPRRPPTRWIPTTSSESSKPHLYLSSIAQIGVSAAHAGVIATRPATAPEAAPTEVGLPSLIFSTTSHASSAAAGAAIVLTMTSDAVLSAASSDPPLNPNQPNHRRPAPSRT